ncbi:MAG TPA: hypothetical protein PKV72_03655 [Candidatus Peribacteria bacterium]|nr:hypothetical protein [Candidatus Peribacteria bacterium]
MSIDAPRDTDEQGKHPSSIVQMSIDRCEGMVVDMADELRRFLEDHRDDDDVLAAAYEVLEEHNGAFDANAFEKGERGRAMILLMRLDALLDRHPKAGPVLHRLLEAERRARARAIDLIRQSENIGCN